MQKKFVISVSSILLIIMIFIIMINSAQAEPFSEYIKLSFMDGMTLIVAVIFAYVLIERGNDERQKKEYCERLIIKIQTQLEEEFLRSPTINQHRQILMTIRSVQNKLNILISVIGESKKMQYIKNNFDKYEELYGDCCNDKIMLSMKKSEFERKLISISDKLDEVLADIYK